MVRPIAIIGAGWAGATVAHGLGAAGVPVEVFESHSVVGGHSRAEILNGVVYEPNGAHIFHTSNPTVRDLVERHGLLRPYEHRVLTQVYLDADDESGRLLSWPPQIEELRTLPWWSVIAKELNELPSAPSAPDFEGYVIQLMGRTLYEIFIRDYTRKQWGCDPQSLSASFAPKRVELRSDGYTRLFRDRWEYFPKDGINSIIESILADTTVHCGVEMSVHDLDDLARTHAAVVITAPLDSFLGRDGELAWRGITMRSTYHPTSEPSTTITSAYVVNHPSERVEYTRTVETKHATGQRVGGTVVSEEYPGAPARHYPVPTVEGTYEAKNLEFKREISTVAPLPVFFCGRLANYLYINQDQAIEQGFACVAELAEHGFVSV